MSFRFLDSVEELTPDRIVTLRRVSADEDYLADHFPTFPVLPGVLMIESMVQAARRLLASRDPALGRHVLGQVRALKYGSFVRPGDTMRVEVAAAGPEGDGGRFDFKGSAVVRRGSAAGEESQTCVSGRFTMRPIRLGGG